MQIHVIQVPYDSGHERARMGRGPEHLVKNGLVELLQAQEHEPNLVLVQTNDEFTTEIGTSFDLARQTSTLVSNAVSQGAFPLVLSGNCNTALGTIAGINPSHLGIIWFDGHGDFRTPDVSPNGFLDSMGLSTAVGLCWKSVVSFIPNFQPISGANVLHVGSRRLHSKERALFDAAGVTLIGADEIAFAGIHETFQAPLAKLRGNVKRVYLHVDLDVLDPGEAPTNEFAWPDGLSIGELKTAVRLVGRLFDVKAIGIASYDPQYDPERRTVEAAKHLVAAALEIISS